MGRTWGQKADNGERLKLETSGLQKVRAAGLPTPILCNKTEGGLCFLQPKVPKAEKGTEKASMEVGEGEVRRHERSQEGWRGP